MRGMIATSVVVLGIGGAADAATVTFDAGKGQYTSETRTVWIEDGVTATGEGYVAPYGVAGAAHLDDHGTGYAKAISFTMDSLFDAQGFDVIPSAFGVVGCRPGTTGFDSCQVVPYQNVRVRGYQADTIVAQDKFNMSEVGGHYDFGAAFRALDRLEIGFAPFSEDPISQEFDRYLLFADYDSHYNIDNVTLAPVPLPVTGGLLLAALAGLGVLRRRSGLRAA